MNSFKPLAIVAILAAIGVGLYLKINSMPAPEPPPDFSGSWGSPPQIDMGGDSLGTGAVTPPIGPPGGTAPAYAPEGGAPPEFVPGPKSETDGFAQTPGGGAPPFNPLPGPNPPTDPGHEHSGAGHDHHAGHTHDPFPPGQASPEFGTTLPVTPPSGNAPPAESPTSLFAAPRHATFDEAWTEARSLLDQGRLSDAHLLLSAWYGDQTLRPEEQQALRELLSGLAGTVIYSMEHHLEPAYSVALGETLEQIAAKYNVPSELLAKINGIRPPATLQPGRQLKVVRGPFSAMVNLSQREMTLVLAGRYAGRFDIGIGSERTNVEGRYAVKQKMANPPYYGPDSYVDAGSPDNPLGTHFLALAKQQLNNEIAAPFGIHGTNDGGNLQGNDPRGYIRLAPEHVADAFDILSVQSEVVIRR